MQRCQHPNIARVLALGQFDDGGHTFVFSVEEFLAGGSLGERLATRGFMSKNSFYPIALQLGDGGTGRLRRRGNLLPGQHR